MSCKHAIIIMDIRITVLLWGSSCKKGVVLGLVFGFPLDHFHLRHHINKDELNSTFLDNIILK